MAFQFLMKTINETYEKIKFYFDKNSPVHITLNNGIWVNGIILNINKSNNRLVLHEEKFGETLVLFSEIKSVLPRMEEE